MLAQIPSLLRSNKRVSFGVVLFLVSSPLVFLAPAGGIGAKINRLVSSQLVTPPSTLRPIVKKPHLQQASTISNGWRMRGLTAHEYQHRQSPDLQLCPVPQQWTLSRISHKR